MGCRTVSVRQTTCNERVRKSLMAGFGHLFKLPCKLSYKFPSEPLAREDSYV